MPLYNVADYLPEFVSAVADTGLDFKEAIQAIFDYHPETFSWEIINNPMFALGNFNKPGNYVIYDGAYHPKVCRAPTDPSSIGWITDLVTPYCVSISETKNDDGTYTLIYAISQFDDILNIRKTSTGIDPDTKLPIYPDMNFSSDDVLHQSSRNYNLIYGNRTEDVSLIIPYGMDPIFAAPELTQNGTKETLIIERHTQSMGDSPQGFTLWSNHGNVWTAIRFKDQMDLDIYDPNRKLKDVFKYSDDEMKAFDTQLADWTKHKANQLTLRHTDADMQKSFNDKLSQDAFAKMKTDKETSAKTLADSAFENILHFDQYEESKDTISESFDSHVASHVTAEDIAGWDSKADGDHVHKADDKNSTLIGVGYSGTIVRSTDAGLTWTKITVSEIGENKVLDAIYYANNTWIIVGNHGTIVRSTDNGLTWSRITVSGKDGNYFHSISYSNNTWIAVGSSSTILRSTDDGLTWEKISVSGVYSDLESAFYSNNTWITVGDSGTILRSTDNGLTWSKITVSGVSSTLYGIHYANNTWIIVGQSGIILRSTDNGLTWAKITVTTNWLYGISYSNHTWIAVGSSGIILRSTDDGLTWAKLTVSEVSDYSFESICYANGTWIITTNTNIIVKSTDNGLTWTAIRVSAINGALQDSHAGVQPTVQIDASNVISGIIDKKRMSEKVKMQKDLIPIYSLESLGVGADKTHLHENQKLKMIPPATWIAGTVNAVHRSTDYGRSWTTITTTCTYPTFMRNNGIVWIMGDEKGNLYRSADDGLSWTLVKTFGIAYMHDMIFYNNTWLVTSAGGYLRKSADNGLTWTDYKVPNTDQGWISIDANPTTNVVIVVGYNGYITRSADGGVTFPKVLNPIGPSTFYAIKYLRDKLWLAVGDSGLIVKTTDDGLTWTKIVNYPNAGIIKYLDYHDGTIILSSGTGSQIIRSADDGITWDAHPIGAIDNMYNIKYCVDGIWRIYLNGTIMESIDDGLTWTFGNSYTGARSAYLADPLDDKFRYFYITDLTKIGSADYMNGLQEYTNRLGQDSEIEWSNIESKPTTLAGYEITDSYKKSDFDTKIKNLTTDITTEKNKVSAIDTQLAEFDKLKYRYEYPYHFDPYADGGFVALLLNNPDDETPNNSKIVPFIDSSTLSAIQKPDKYAIVVGSSGTILRSIDDGLTWTRIVTGINDGVYSIYYSNNTWITVGDGGTILRSIDDGLTWTRITVSGISDALESIYYSNDTWITVGFHGTILRSADNGLTWSKITVSGLNANLWNIYYSNHTWITVGTSGTILRSIDDGLTWSKITVSGLGTNILYGIFHFNNTWIAVGASSTILRSTDDGLTWTKITSGISSYLWSIYYGNNTWIAVGLSGTILRSTDDGLTWTKITSGISDTLNGIYYSNNNTWIAVGARGTILRSTDDGLTWTKISVSGVDVILRNIRSCIQIPIIPHSYDTNLDDATITQYMIQYGVAPPESATRSIFTLEISKDIYGLTLGSTYTIENSKYKGTIIGFRIPDQENIEFYTSSSEPYSDSNITWIPIPNSKINFGNSESKKSSLGDILYIPETDIVICTCVVQDTSGERLIIAKMPNEKDGTEFQALAQAISGSQKSGHLDTCRSYFIWGCYENATSTSWLLIYDTSDEYARLRPQYVIEDEIIAISHSDTMWVCLCKTGIYTHPIGNDPEVTPFVKIPIVLKDGSQINTTLHDIAYGNNTWMMVGTDETNFYIYKSWDSMKTWVLNTTISIEKIRTDFEDLKISGKASHAMLKFINYQWLCTVVLLKDTTYMEFNYTAYITNGLSWMPMSTHAHNTYTDIHDNNTFLYGRDIRILDWKGNHYSRESLIARDEIELPNSDINMSFGGFAIKNEVDLDTPWIIVGQNGTILRSIDDGLTWGVVMSEITGYLNDVNYSNNTWITVGNDGIILRSTDDGLTWTKINSGVSNSLYKISYSNKIWIIAGQNGTILRSIDDGLTWTKINSGVSGSKNLLGLEYHGIWIAVGLHDTILRSTDDGLTWTNVGPDAAFNTNFYTIAYGNKLWIITGLYGIILRSTDDGLTWTKITTGIIVSGGLQNIHYSNGVWVTVGDFGAIQRSTDDGLTWTDIRTASVGLSGIMNFNNTWMITGDSGTILQSTDDGLTWTKITKINNNSLKGIAAAPPYPVGYNPYTNRVYREIEGYKYIGAVNDYNAAAVDMIKESKKTIDALDLSEFK